MAQYDTPPGIDPSTGRIPPYKQVLSQDNSTGMYKVKYEYTKSSPLTRNQMTVRPGPVPAVTPLPISYYENPADVIKRGLTTPQTTFGSSGGYMGGGGGGTPPGSGGGSGSGSGLPGTGTGTPTVTVAQNPNIDPARLGDRGSRADRENNALPESFDFENASLLELGGILNPSFMDQAVGFGVGFTPLATPFGLAMWNQRRLATNELNERLENNPETFAAGFTLDQLKELSEMDLTPTVNAALETTIKNWSPNVPVQKPVNPNTYTGPFPVQKPVNPNAVAPGDEMSELDKIAERTAVRNSRTTTPRGPGELGASTRSDVGEAVREGNIQGAINAARRSVGTTPSGTKLTGPAEFGRTTSEAGQREINSAHVAAATNNSISNYGSKNDKERRNVENNKEVAAAREVAGNTEAKAGREVDTNNAVGNKARSNEVSDKYGNAVTNTNSNSGVSKTTAVNFGGPQVSEKQKADGAGGDKKGRIICSELYNKGLISKEDYMLDLYYTSKHLTPQHTAGYWHFAVPAVKAMRRSKFWTAFWREIAYNRLQDIKWRLGYGKFTLKGRIYSAIFEPFCYISGYFKPNATYKELYKGEY